MITTIYLVRHGEVDNPNGIIYGRLPNFGLTKKGKEELKKTAAFLKDKHVDALYSSPMLRAQQTAEVINQELRLPAVITAQELLEVQSSYEGGKIAHLDALQSEVYLKPLSASDETIEQLADRMKKFVAMVISEHKGKSITAVSHGDPIMAIKAVLKQRPLDFYSFKTDNYVQHGEIYKIKADGDMLSIAEVFKPQSI